MYSHAQRHANGRNEFGGMVGVSSYYGDLFHGYKLKDFHPSFTFYYQRNFNSFFQYRLGANYLGISGSDENSKNYQTRNLSFQSNIYEISNNIIFNFQPFGSVGWRDKSSTVYVLTGLNAFNFDPKASGSQQVSLQPYNNNSNGKYWRMQASVPLGIGFKIKGRDHRRSGANVFAFEMQWRKTFTDNLDDVSGSYNDYSAILQKSGTTVAQFSHAEVATGRAPFMTGMERGDSHLKDWYYFIGISLSLRMAGASCYNF